MRELVFAMTHRCRTLQIVTLGAGAKRFFFDQFRRYPINSKMGVTFGREVHLGVSVGELAKTPEVARALAKGHTLTRETKLSFATLATAAIQGICAFVVAMNAAKLALGFTSVAAAGGSSFIHSDPVRLALRYVSAALATGTLYVIWNGWRLRSRRESQWRRAPLARREKWTIAFGLLSAAASWFLIIAEVFAHQRIHPR